MIPPSMIPEIDLTRGRYAIATLRAGIVTDLLLLGCAAVNLSLYARLAADEFVSEAQLSAIDTASTLIGLVSLLLMVATIVCFIRWLTQARRNVVAMGARGLVHSREWAVWGWFVPILNLFRPYQVIEEVWRGSSAQFGRALAVMAAPVPSILGIWWGAWLVNGVLGQIAFRMTRGLTDAADLADYIQVERMIAFSGIASVVAAFLAIRVVRGLDDAQRAQRARMVDEAESILWTTPASGPALA